MCMLLLHSFVEVSNSPKMPFLRSHLGSMWYWPPQSYHLGKAEIPFMASHSGCFKFRLHIPFINFHPVFSWAIDTLLTKKCFMNIWTILHSWRIDCDSTPTSMTIASSISCLRDPNQRARMDGVQHCGGGWRGCTNGDLDRWMGMIQWFEIFELQETHQHLGSSWDMDINWIKLI